MKITCVCKHEFEGEPTAEAGWLVTCPNCGATLRVRPEGVTGKKFRAGIRTAEHKGEAAAKPEAVSIAQRARIVEVVCCILWAAVGVAQIVLLYTAAAGVWNVINAIIRLRSAKNIQAANPNVPAYFEQRKTWLIVLAVVNVVLGGVIGVFLVLVDWYNREYVLKNRASFEQ